VDPVATRARLEKARHLRSESVLHDPTDLRLIVDNEYGVVLHEAAHSVVRRSRILPRTAVDDDRSTVVLNRSERNREGPFAPARCASARGARSPGFALRLGNRSAPPRALQDPPRHRRGAAQGRIPFLQVFPLYNGGYPLGWACIQRHTDAMMISGSLYFASQPSRSCARLGSA